MFLSKGEEKPLFAAGDKPGNIRCNLPDQTIIKSDQTIRYSAGYYRLSALEDRIRPRTES